MRLFIYIVLILSGVTGCGSNTEGQGLRETLVATIKARKEAKAAEKLPKKAPVILTREAIAHIKKPLLQIEAQNLGMKSLFAQVAKNGAYRTYLNNAKMSVTLNQGIITATRGFGLDLLSQGISITPQEMFAETNAPKLYTRTQQQLLNIKTVTEISYNCTLKKETTGTLTIVDIDYELTKFSEICRNQDRAFSSYYWVDIDTGHVWKSAQSIGQQAGYFITEVLVP